MNGGSTLFLRFVIFILALAMAVLAIFAAPIVLNRGVVGGYQPILFGMYLTLIPFYIAIYQTLKLLDSIDKNTAFSETSVKALKYIKYCGLTISGMYIVGMPYIFSVAERDDAPGVILIAMAFAAAPLVVAVFAAVLQKLL